LLKNGLQLFHGFIYWFYRVGAGLAGIIIFVSFSMAVITSFKVPFVATPATDGCMGLTMLYRSHPISNLGEGFAFIGTGLWLGIPVPVWIAVVVVLLAVFITQKTKLGRYIYAIGGDETAARLSGIRINKVKLLVYMIGGALAALGGVIVTSRLDSAQPNAGISYELDAIAAVVIGGTSLNGGRGTVWGTLSVRLLLSVKQWIGAVNVSPFWQQVVKGGVILLAVIIDKVGDKKEQWGCQL
jgi:ribose transport system permease protein